MRSQRQQRRQRCDAGSAGDCSNLHRPVLAAFAFASLTFPDLLFLFILSLSHSYPKPPEMPRHVPARNDRQPNPYT